MKLHEVVETLGDNRDYWFRPVSWRGSGQAYTIILGSTYVVPSSKGGEIGMTTNPTELAGEWEIVNADTVLGERG